MIQTEKLDNLIKQMTHTFENAEFRENPFDSKDLFLWESKLDYKISKYLFNKGGKPNEEALDYIRNKTGWAVSARDRDGLGWYTGNICKVGLDGKDRTILFG